MKEAESGRLFRSFFLQSSTPLLFSFAVDSSELLTCFLLRFLLRRKVTLATALSITSLLQMSVSGVLRSCLCLSKFARTSLRTKIQQINAPTYITSRSFANELGKGIGLVESDFHDKVSGKRRIQVKGLGETSFKIDETLVSQSVILLPHSFLLWNAKTFEDINEKSLFLFPLIFPALEVLYVGCGEVQPGQLPIELTRLFRSKGIVLEATSTSNAASMFNVLNAEGRNVGAALLTLQPSNVIFRPPRESML